MFYLPFSRYNLCLLQILFIAIFISISIFSCNKEKEVATNAGYYTCSMHPQVIKKEPGTCPICRMDLTYIETQLAKLENHEDLPTDTNHKKSNAANIPRAFRFSLTQTVLANANIATSPAKKEPFSRQAKYSAHLDYNEDPNRLVVVTTKYDGWVQKLFVSKEGQYVKKGQALMEIYSPSILAAKEEYVTTFHTLLSLFSSQDKPLDKVYKDPTLKAVRHKLLYLDVPQAEITRLEKGNQVAPRTYYRASISGVVVKKQVLQGAAIKAGQEIMRIANLSRLWAYIHVFEKDLPFIKKGQKVILKTQGYPDKEFKGYVDLIYPFLDTKSKDIKVHIIINNPQKILKPGMFAEVRMKQELKGEHIIIPDSAIIYSGNKSYVFISLGAGKFELRPLMVKLTSDGKALISSGLAENEQVVINSQFLLDSEASLKEAIHKIHLH